MEIICAGYWKTGSKSCSAALRELGYNVADGVETGQFLTSVWKNYIEEKCQISEVIEYQKNNFHANQDCPGNYMWEDLYDASPNAKVILTVRDSDDQFIKSITNFMRQDFEKLGDPWTYIFQKFQAMHFGGKKDAEFNWLLDYVTKTYVLPGIDPTKKFFLVKNQMNYIQSYNKVLRQGYNRHIAYIKATVPADRLLVWNVKEGWEPLCKFLGKPIPDKPIPHDNKTEDINFIEDMFMASDFGKEMMSNMQKNFALWVLKHAGIITLITLEHKSGWKHTKKIGNYFYQAVSKYL